MAQFHNPLADGASAPRLESGILYRQTPSASPSLMWGVLKADLHAIELYIANGSGTGPADSLAEMQLYLAQVSNFVLYPDRVTIAITSMGTTHQLQFYTPGEAELWRDWVQRGLTLRRNSNASAQIHPTSAGAALTGIAGPRTQALGRLEDQPFFVGAIERPAAEQMLKDDLEPGAHGGWLVRKSNRDGQLVLSWLRTDGRKGHVKIVKRPDGLYAFETAKPLPPFGSVMELLQDKPTLSEIVGDLPPYAPLAATAPVSSAFGGSGSMTSSTSTMLSPSVLPAMPADSGLLHLSMAISDDSSNSLSRTPVSVLPPELSYINQEAVDNHSRHGTLTMGGFGGDANTDDDIDVSGESLPPLPGGGLNFGGPPQLPNRGGGGGGAMPPPVPNTPRPTASFSGDMPPPVPNTPRPGSISMSSSLQMSPGAPPPVPDSPRPRPSVSQQPQPQPTSMFPPGMIPMELRRLAQTSTVVLDRHYKLSHIPVAGDVLQAVQYTANGVITEMRMPSVEKKHNFLNKYILRDGESGEGLFMVCDTYPQTVAGTMAACLHDSVGMQRALSLVLVDRNANVLVSMNRISACHTFCCLSRLCDFQPVMNVYMYQNRIGSVRVPKFGAIFAPTYFVTGSDATRGLRIVGKCVLHRWGCDTFSIQEKIGETWREVGSLKRVADCKTKLAAAMVEGFEIKLPADIDTELRVTVLACALYIDYVQFGAQTDNAHLQLDLAGTSTKPRRSSCWPWIGCCFFNCGGCIFSA